MMQIMHMSARAVTPLAAPERRAVGAVVTTDDRTMEAIGQEFAKALGAGKPTIRPPSPSWLFSEARAEGTAARPSGSAPAATNPATTADDTLFDLFARIVAKSEA